MLEGMRMMIDWQRCGFTLSGEACTAQDALHMVDTLRPHLLITDVKMPGILGTDLASIVNRYHPEILILFFSGYRDFSYAQSAIRAHAFGYLLKPIDVEEVESTLLKAKAELDSRQAATLQKNGQPQVLRDQALIRIACGDDGADTLLRASVLLELKSDDPCYCAVLSHRRVAMPETARFALASMDAALFELSPKEYGLAFRQIERDLPALRRLMKLIADPDSYVMSVGGVYGGAAGFQKSMQEALDAQGVLYETNDGLRLYKPLDAQTAAWLEMSNLPALRGALTGGRGEALEEGIAALERAVAQAQPSLFSLRYMAATLDAMLPIAVSDSSSLSPPLWQQDAADRDAWLQAFEGQLRARRQAIAPQMKAEAPDPVRETLAAIRSRYGEPLVLSGIAGELHINPAYLGQLVKKHTGATFHRHLLMTRIERACLLLRRTLNPVGEIAAEVGFQDVDYFSQQFRSRMGMSPVAYRNAVNAEEDRHAPHQ